MAHLDSSPNHFDETLSFTKAPNKLAYEYWLACCAGRPMPMRADLNPGQMKKFSPHVGLVEMKRQPDGQLAYCIRRAGSRWEDVYGPMTGKRLEEFLPPAVGASWIEAFDRVRESHRPVRLTARIDFNNKNWLLAEMLIAPLGNGTVDMLMTNFVSWASPTQGLESFRDTADVAAPNSAAH